MNDKRMARNGGNRYRAETAPGRAEEILAEYERWTHVAGIVFGASFLLMLVGAVMFGW